jgi:DNA-binding transcriptional LysR family regulator
MRQQIELREHFRRGNAPRHAPFPTSGMRSATPYRSSHPTNAPTTSPPQDTSRNDRILVWPSGSLRGSASHIFARFYPSNAGLAAMLAMPRTRQRLTASGHCTPPQPVAYVSQVWRPDEYSMGALQLDRFEAMHLFARVTEAGSFSAVARELAVGQPTVSKHIAALEAHLGVKLIHRTSRRLALTDAGHAYYEAAAKVLADLESVERLVGHGALRPSGLLRFAVPAALSSLHLIPLLPEFCDLFPDVEVELVETNRAVDLQAEGLDLAIRVGDLVDMYSSATPIGSSPRITVAACTYLDRAGEPATIADLERYACIAYTMPHGPEPWVFDGIGGLRRYVPKGRVRAGSPESARAAALAGLGIAQGPLWLFAADIARHMLREVLTDHRAPSVSIHAVFPTARRLPTKVRAFVDFTAAAFARNPAFRSH